MADTYIIVVSRAVVEQLNGEWSNPVQFRFGDPPDPTNSWHEQPIDLYFRNLEKDGDTYRVVETPS